VSRRLWAVLAIVLAVAALVGVNLYYTAYQQRVADRRWCDLLVTLDQPEVPATNDRGRLIQLKIHALRDRFGCPRS
jgi:hypothetical protein